MAEFEELRLTVTLVDNASTGLATLRQNLRALGGSENRDALERMSKQVEHLGTQMKGVQEHAAKATGAMNALGRQIGTTVGALAGAFVGNFMLKGLRDFTDEVIRLDTAAKTFGVGGANLKALVEQMKVMGVDGDAATRTVTSFQTALADLSRTGSQTRFNLMQGARSDQAGMAALLQRITGFASKGQMASALNEIIEAAQNVFDAEMKRTGGNEGVAAELRNRFLENWKIDPSVLMQLKATLHDATDAEKEEYDRRRDAALAFDNAMRVTAKNYKEFIEGLQSALLPVLKSSQ